MFDRDVARMAAFKDISDAQIKAIQAPALVINGDVDVVRPRKLMITACLDALEKLM